MKFEGLENIPNAEDLTKSFEEKPEETEDKKEGYDDLKEAYMRDMEDRGIETDEDDDNNNKKEVDMEVESAKEKVTEEVEKKTETVIEEVKKNNEQVGGDSNENFLFYEEVGRQKWESMFQKISNFVKELAENEKKGVYILTGAVSEQLEGMHGLARESFDQAVDNAEKETQKIKAESIEKATKAKTEFLERVAGVKGKYVAKALEFKERGTEWGTKKATQVEGTIAQTCENINGLIQKRVQADMEKYEKKTTGEGVEFSKLIREIGERGAETEKDVKSMEKAFDNVGELSS